MQWALNLLQCHILQENRSIFFKAVNFLDFGVKLVKTDQIFLHEKYVLPH